MKSFRLGFQSKKLDSYQLEKREGRIWESILPSPIQEMWGANSPSHTIAEFPFPTEMEFRFRKKWKQKYRFWFFFFNLFLFFVFSFIYFLIFDRWIFFFFIDKWRIVGVKKLRRTWKIHIPLLQFNVFNSSNTKKLDSCILVIVKSIFFNS